MESMRTSTLQAYPLRSEAIIGVNTRTFALSEGVPAAAKRVAVSDS
ncbi:hypothetical protein KIMH_07240 [Bombiscardovia apis]|uniref:Uncharacterized protein n=1 Tax=Bombiscardovia apis TaxID=2932182 RepID=A0ABN6SGI8_9BIFI|nr:hypothetical protein KIMH_07240 [Bombiscardovia apis]